MKRLILCLFIVIAFRHFLDAQPGVNPIRYITADPTGQACAATAIALQTPNGNIYTCVSGVYVLYGSSSGGCTSSGADGTVQLAPCTAGSLAGAIVGSTSLNGSQLLTQQAAPPATAMVAALAGIGTGALSNGGYIYVVTYLTANGETNGKAANCGSFDVTVVDSTMNGQVALSSIPIGPAGTLGRNIYRTNAAPPGSQAGCRTAHLVVSIANNSATTYIDNIPDASLGAPYIDSNTSGYRLETMAGDLLEVPINGGNYFGVERTLFSNPNDYGFLDFVDLIYGVTLNISVWDHVTGGVSLFPNSTAGPGLVINNLVLGNGTIPSNAAADRFTTNYNGSDNYANKLGAPLFGVDVDFAADAGAGYPFVFSAYNGEDGSHFQGGFSHAGGFFGVNMAVAPADSMAEIAGTVFPAKAVASIRAAPSQTAPLLKFKGSNDTDLTTAFVAKDGTLATGATTVDPGCSTTADIGKFWLDNTTTTTASKICKNIAGTLTWVALGSSSTTGNAANEVAVAFSATPTFTCGSATAGTATHFTVGALTANITSSTLATCTAGQVIGFHFVQDGTGGRTVAMPTNWDALAIAGNPSTATDAEYWYDGTNGRLTSVNGKATPFLVSLAPCRAAASSTFDYPSGDMAFWCDSTTHAPTFGTNAGGTLYIAALIKAAATSHSWVDHIDANGTQNVSQPAFTDISGVAATSQIPAVNLPTPGATCTFTANSTICVATTTATITVPAPAAGYQFCVLNDDNVSTVITLSAIGSSARYENTARTAYGTAGTGTFVSSGAVGDAVCILGRDSTHYLTTSFSGAWTAN